MRTYIWTIPTRLFHWSLAFAFTLAFILGGEEEYLGLHAALGMLIFASGDTGIFGFRLNPGSDQEIFEEVHDVAVHLFLILLGIHLTGILADTIFHPGNRTIGSVFTGYKRIEAPPAVSTTFQTIFSIAWFGIPLIVFFYVLRFQAIPAGEKENTEQVSEPDKDED